MRIPRWHGALDQRAAAAPYACLTEEAASFLYVLHDGVPTGRRLNQSAGLLKVGRRAYQVQTTEDAAKDSWRFCQRPRGDGSAHRVPPRVACRTWSWPPQPAPWAAPWCRPGRMLRVAKPVVPTALRAAGRGAAVGADAGNPYATAGGVMRPQPERTWPHYTSGAHPGPSSRPRRC